MPKAEVLATSFILTLTIISTVPISSADLKCSFSFLSNRESQIENHKFSYDLADTNILKHKKYLKQEKTTFYVSNTLSKFSTKIKQKTWNFNTLNSRFALWRETNFSDGTQPILLTPTEAITKSTLSFTKPDFSYKFIDDLTFKESNIKTFSTQNWTRPNPDNAIAYQEAWTTNSNNIDTSITETEAKIIAEPLPVISLIITSLFCLFSPKKSRVS